MRGVLEGFSDFRYYLLCIALKGEERETYGKRRTRNILCKSSVTGSEHEVPLPLPPYSVIPPENRFAYNKPKRLLREIAFLQTEAFDVASPF